MKKGAVNVKYDNSVGRHIGSEMGAIHALTVPPVSTAIEAFIDRCEVDESLLIRHLSIQDRHKEPLAVRGRYSSLAYK